MDGPRSSRIKSTYTNIGYKHRRNQSEAKRKRGLNLTKRRRKNFSIEKYSSSKNSISRHNQTFLTNRSNYSKNLKFKKSRQEVEQPKARKFEKLKEMVDIIENRPECKFLYNPLDIKKKKMLALNNQKKMLYKKHARDFMKNDVQIRKERLFKLKNRQKMGSDLFFQNKISSFFEPAYKKKMTDGILEDKGKKLEKRESSASRFSKKIQKVKDIRACMTSKGKIKHVNE